MFLDQISIDLCLNCCCHPRLLWKYKSLKNLQFTLRTRCFSKRVIDRFSSVYQWLITSKFLACIFKSCNRVNQNSADDMTMLEDVKTGPKIFPPQSLYCHDFGQSDRSIFKSARAPGKSRLKTKPNKTFKMNFFWDTFYWLFFFWTSLPITAGCVIYTVLLSKSTCSFWNLLGYQPMVVMP